jgi:hypothetical protein
MQYYSPFTLADWLQNPEQCNLLHLGSFFVRRVKHMQNWQLTDNTL